MLRTADSILYTLRFQGVREVCGKHQSFFAVGVEKLLRGVGLGHREAVCRPRQSGVMYLWR